MVCAARTQPEIDEVAARVRALGRRAIAVPCDVMERAQLEALVARAMAELGRIDVLVNNAGGSPWKPFLRTSEAMFEEAFRFNVTSAFLLARLAVPHMLATDGGAIVNISSAMGRITDRRLQRLRHRQGRALAPDPAARERARAARARERDQRRRGRDVRARAVPRGRAEGVT